MRDQINRVLIKSARCLALSLIIFSISVPLLAEDQVEQSEEVDVESNLTLEEGETLPRSTLAKQYHESIEAVLASEDFAQKKSVTRWRWKKTEEVKESDKVPEWIIAIIEFFEKNEGKVKTMSAVFEFILWSALVVLILFLVWHYRHGIGQLIGGQSKTAELDLPTTMFGLDVKKESLPDDVIKAAQELWSQQQTRPAIALLLRASIIKVLHDYEVKLFDSDTEEECCDRIDQQASQSVGVYMRKLVHVWQWVAYAHKNASDAQFAELCQQWQEVF